MRGVREHWLQIAKREGERIDSWVDEQGYYSRQMGHQLEGKSVLGEALLLPSVAGDGATKVLEVLKRDVVNATNYTHSYPYDWRTKKVRCGLHGEVSACDHSQQCPVVHGRHASWRTSS